MEKLEETETNCNYGGFLNIDCLTVCQIDAKFIFVVYYIKAWETSLLDKKLWRFHSQVISRVLLTK